MATRRRRLEMRWQLFVVVAVSIFQLLGVQRRIAEHVLDEARLVVIVELVRRHVGALVQRVVLGGVAVGSLALATAAMRCRRALVAKTDVRRRGDARSGGRRVVCGLPVT